MNIYTKENNDIRKIILSFFKTIYGKTIFLLSYSISFIALIISILIFCLRLFNSIYPETLFISLIVTIVSFVLGSNNFYKELRIFVQDQNKNVENKVSEKTKSKNNK